MSTPAPATPAATSRAGGLSVLAVTSQIPWPLDTGGHIRSFHILRSLARRFRLRLVTTAPAGERSGVEALRRHGITTCAAALPRHARWTDVFRAAGAATAGEPYVLFRKHDRAAVRAVLRAEFDREPPDVVYLDHLDSFVYRAMRPQTPYVIDLHNVYSMLAGRVASEQSSRWLRSYLRRESTLLERVERRAVRDADRVVAVSEADGRVFEGFGARAVTVVPNGVDCDAYASLPTGRDSAAPSILYVGAMSWGPNVAAVEFLARTVLPAVLAVMPAARLRVVGRDPSPQVTALGRLPGVEVVGGVADILPHLADARVLAVPLRAGGGTRLKILEAFAAGLPVVSTPVGCEGLGCVDSEHLTICEPECFADAILPLLKSPALGQNLAARARVLARERFDWASIGDLACDAVDLAATGRSPRSPVLAETTGSGRSDGRP